MAEHRHSDRSRSRSPRHHENDRREDRRDEVVPRFKLEETRTLLIEGGGADLAEAENVFRELSINIGTSVPDEVTADGNNLFVKYPSIQAATAVVEHQAGTICLAKKNLRLQYYPIRRVDLSLSYDWYCDKCDYKNFARRNRCYRCQSEKTPTCRLSYSTQPAVKQVREESALNCSLMVRGPAVAEIEQADLLASFQALAPVRDIRQIRNKLTGKFKDFAFIQFYTPEQTAQAYREGNDPQFRLSGQKVTVMYSRNKSEDDYFKPLPYETGRRQKRARERPPQEDNYYHRQRQREIEIQKARPAITMEQLKEKRQQQMKRNQPAAKQLSEQQSKRRQAELLAKQWEREMKTQATMYICPACNRKFNSADQMLLHEKNSDLHKYHMLKLNNMTLAL